MHRNLPESNTKLVLILARPWALPTLAGSSRIPSQSCFAGPGLHGLFVDDVLTTGSI